MTSDQDSAASAVESLTEFHTIFGHPVGDLLYSTDEQTGRVRTMFRSDFRPETWRLRRSLIGEEFGELIVAANAGDVLGVADALADLTYVIVGTAVVYGSPHVYLMGGPSFPPISRVIEKFGNLTFPAQADPRIADFADAYASYYSHAAMGDSATVCRSLANLHRQVIGISRTYDIPLDAMFAEVHRSNMSKLGADGQPIYREVDRKVLKGPNYTPPNLPEALAQFHASLPFEQARANLTSEEVSARVGLAVDRNISLDEAHGVLSSKR